MHNYSKDWSTFYSSPPKHSELSDFDAKAFRISHLFHLHSSVSRVAFCVRCPFYGVKLASLDDLIAACVTFCFFLMRVTTASINSCCDLSVRAFQQLNHIHLHWFFGVHFILAGPPKGNDLAVLKACHCFLLFAIVCLQSLLRRIHVGVGCVQGVALQTTGCCTNVEILEENIEATLWIAIDFSSSFRISIS